MKGAREYAKLFEVEQLGRLFICSGSHARGKTFHIYVLPEGVEAIKNGPNAPLNEDAVEVYGIVSGQRGWTEEYGWLRHGKWQEDFEAIVATRLEDIAKAQVRSKEYALAKEAVEKSRVEDLLSSY